MYEDLSKKQKLILDYIRDEVIKKGYPPSVREICTAVDLKSTSTVHGHLKKLEISGYIRRDPTKPRAIEILGLEQDQNFIDTSNNTTYIPIVGDVTAGSPILAIENIEENFPLPSDLVSDGTYFMLRVQGDSMIEAGILDKDYVIIRKQNDAKNGDAVLALLEDSATIKTFYKEKDHIRLQPENSMLEPIITKDVMILGVVKGVFRKF